MNERFPITLELLEKTDGWLSRLLATSPTVKQSPVAGGFVWRFEDETPLTVMICKAARMISGVRAAWLLVQSGYTTESSSLLRIVSDFGSEIVAVAEGVLADQLTSAQQEFVRQFFLPRPRTLAEHLVHKKERYVNRAELLNSQLRLANARGGDGEHLRNLKRAMDFGFDGYVHGTYDTTMELYHGGLGAFMLHGHESDHVRCLHAVSVSGKLRELILSFSMISEVVRDNQLFDELVTAMNQLDESGEYEGVTCE